MKKSYFFLLLCLLFILLFINIILNEVSLVDDIVLKVKAKDLESGKITFNELFQDIMSFPIMTSRPVSAFFTVFLIYFTSLSPIFYQLTNIVLLFIVIVLLFKVVILYLKDINIAIFTCLLAIIVPLSPATLFSPIMINSNLAIIFYLISLLSIYKPSYRNIIFSSVAFLLSILSYEVCFFFIFLNLFIIYHKSHSTKKLLLGFSPVLLYIIYKYLIEPIIFQHYFHRQEITNIFDFNKYISLFIRILGLFAETGAALYKSIIAISFYTIIDYLNLLLILTISIITLKNIEKYNKRYNNIINKKVVLLVFILFCSGFLIYFFSSYTPSLKMFKSRTLEAIKITYSLFLSTLFVFLIYHFKNKIFKNILKFFFLLIIISYSITTISEKNAWIYAHNYNHKIMHNLIKILKDKNIEDSSVTIFTIYNLVGNNHLIEQEPIFALSWEFNSLAKLYDKNYAGQRIFLSPESEDFFGFKINKNYPNWEISKDKFYVEGIAYKFPFYIFNYDLNKIYTIESIEDFNNLFNKK